MTSPENKERVRCAQQYFAAGLGLIPVKLDGSRSPWARPWKQLMTERLDIAQAERVFSEYGIGIIGGAVSGNLEIIDCDDEATGREYLQLLGSMCPELLSKLTQIRTPRPGLHLYYRCEAPVSGNDALAMAAKNKKLIEKKSEGGYVLAPGNPPEAHPTGRLYEHIGGPPLTELSVITAEERETLLMLARSLTRLVEEAATPKEFAPHGEGKRDFVKEFDENVPWPAILESAGWTLFKTTSSMNYWSRPDRTPPGVSASTGLQGSDLRELMRVFSSSTQFETNRCYNKLAAYAILHHGNDWKAAIKEAIRQGYLKDEPQKLNGGPYYQGSDDGDDDVSTPTATWQPYPVDSLPDVVRRYVASAAQAMGCDPSYVALPALVMLGACIGDSRRLLIKRGWAAPPILWGAIVGDSGSMKSPACRAALRPLRIREHVAIEMHRSAMREHQQAIQLYERDLATWRRSKSSAPAPTKPEPPACRRQIVSDITIEGLATRLQDCPRGLLVDRDELSGWVGSFDRYAGGGGDEAHWLSMYNGEPLLVDRKTSGTIYVPSALVSIVGSIQPATLHRVMGSRHRESGLLARMLLVSPPRAPKRWSEAAISSADEAALNDLVDTLCECEPGMSDTSRREPRLVTMTAAAKAVWVAWYDSHGTAQVSLVGERAALAAKVEETAARLALIVHLARWATGETSDADRLDETSMAAGVTLASWHLAEALRVYDMLLDGGADPQVARLLTWVRQRGRAVSARDVARGCRWIGTAEAAEQALNDLSRLGHGRWDTTSPTERGGRPGRIWRIRVDETSENCEKTEVPSTVDSVDASNDTDDEVLI